MDLLSIFFLQQIQQTEFIKTSWLYLSLQELNLNTGNTSGH